MMGVVYFGRYLRFMEAAEAEFFRALGFTYDALANEHGVWFARAHLACDYRAPARLDDEIVCRAELTKLGGASLTLRLSGRPRRRDAAGRRHAGAGRASTAPRCAPRISRPRCGSGSRPVARSRKTLIRRL